jgi:hypothetical protein
VASLFSCLLLGTLVVAACAGDPAPTVLQPIDLRTSEDSGKFEPNNISDPAAFTDIETLDDAAIQRFFSNTPYGRPSFLETYQSNGVRATDAVIRAAIQYRINPMVFLVFAQTAQGLLGERNYPFPPDRVEYVFRCGCLEAKTCVPELAGFDRQVDCLGRALRFAIDEIKVKQKTTSGWGPNKESLSLDGVTITPDNDATAVLYDRLPRVNQGKSGGTWVYWNVWNLYARQMDCAGPAGSTDGRWIGEPCVVDASCALQDAICATNYPDGLCTVPCTGDCPSQPSKAETFCAKFRDGGFCFQVCNPGSPACRQGYKCIRVAGMEDGVTQHVCSPESLGPSDEGP